MTKLLLKELKKTGLDLSDSLYNETDRLAGWLCSYVPEEIIHASGFHPIRISGSGRPITKADILLHSNMCPFVRSLFDDAMEGKFSHLSAVVFTNSCDAMRRLFDAWSTFLQKDSTFYLDPPRDKHQESVAFYAEMLKDFAFQLEKQSPQKITAESLKKSIQIFNHTRLLIKRVSELTSNHLISSMTAFYIMQMATQCNREKFNDKLNQFLEGLSNEKKVQKGVRILLTGCIIDKPDQIKLIEDAGAHVVINELCNGSRHFDYMVSDNIDPFYGLAERYLNKAPCSRMLDENGRKAHLLRLAKEHKIDGVIYYIIKFCDNYMWDLPMVVDFFEEHDIPVLNIEGDYIQGSYGSLQTRIQAFVESLQF